jgi:hypothetical protein
MEVDLKASSYPLASPLTVGGLSVLGAQKTGKTTPEAHMNSRLQQEVGKQED